MSRWKAASIHLGISALIALGVIAALVLVWYPPPLFQASGLEQFLIILLGVDVVVGPLLTLIVFRASKPEIRTDMTVIALAQVAALIYGLHVMWQARPVYMVAAVDRLTLVTAADLEPEHLEAAAATPYGRPPMFGAALVGATPPADPAEREAVMRAATQGGKDYDLRPQYYVPYEQVAMGLVGRGRPVEQLVARYPEQRDAIAAAAGDVGEDGLVFVPLKTARRFITAVLVAETGAVAVMLDVDPWQVVAPAEQ